MNELISLVEEFMTSVFDLKIFLGIIVAIIVIILEIRFLKYHKKRNKRIEKAIRKGHVVRAKRIKSWDDDTSGYSVDSWCYATYIYEVNGVSYRYKYMSKQVPPITMDLYYTNNPRKAFSRPKKESGVLSIMFYILPMAAAVIVINLLNGI